MYETIEICCDIKHETAAAFLIESGEQECWIPKSQVANPNDFHEGDEAVEIEIPEWLAVEKGLV